MVRTCNNLASRCVRAAGDVATGKVRIGCNPAMVGQPALPSPFANPAVLPGMHVRADLHEDTARERAGRLADAAGNPTGHAISARPTILWGWSQVATPAFPPNSTGRPLSYLQQSLRYCLQQGAKR